MILLCSKKLAHVKGKQREYKNTFTECKFYGRNNVFKNWEKKITILKRYSALYSVHCCIRCEEIMTPEKVEGKKDWGRQKQNDSWKFYFKTLSFLRQWLLLYKRYCAHCAVHRNIECLLHARKKEAEKPGTCGTVASNQAIVALSEIVTW